MIVDFHLQLSTNNQVAEFHSGNICNCHTFHRKSVFGLGCSAHVGFLGMAMALRDYAWSRRFSKTHQMGC